MTTTNPAQRSLPVFLAWLEQSRQRGQVHYDAKQQSWQVLGHPEAASVLSDPATFSSDLTQLLPAQDDLALFQKGNFVRMDPPPTASCAAWSARRSPRGWWPAWNRASPRSPPNCSTRPAAAGGWT